MIECKNQCLNTIRSKRGEPAFLEASGVLFWGSGNILALCSSRYPSSSSLSLCPSLSGLLAPAKESDPKLS